MLQIFGQAVSQRSSGPSTELGQRLSERLAVLRLVQDVHSHCQLQAGQAQVSHARHPASVTQDIERLCTRQPFSAVLSLSSASADVCHALTLAVQRSTLTCPPSAAERMLAALQVVDNHLGHLQTLQAADAALDSCLEQLLLRGLPLGTLLQIAGMQQAASGSGAEPQPRLGQVAMSMLHKALQRPDQASGDPQPAELVYC